MDAKRGFMQFLPMLILGIAAVSTFIILGAIGKNQDIRGRAADEGVYPTITIPSSGNKCCPIDPTNASQVNTCSGLSDSRCGDFNTSCTWASSCPTAPVVTPIPGNCCPKDATNASQVNTCTGLSNGNCTGTYSASCSWVSSGDCQHPEVTP
ncbi:MAG: hypothetical protein NTY06_03805, partial [Candidatus Gottesmanbacteria bacterium]|nr:hypothetical protein [Candidatus Gottesmanbacteria bacterium]